MKELRPANKFAMLKINQGNYLKNAVARLLNGMHVAV